MDINYTMVVSQIRFQWIGCWKRKKTVVVLTRDHTYQKKPMKYINLIKKAFKEYPNLQHDLENRHIVYNETLDKIDKLEREGQIFVIRPSKPIACAMIEKDPNHLYKKFMI